MLSLTFISFLFLSFVNGEVNNRPIIGVLTAEISNKLRQTLPPDLDVTSHLYASYVKFLESAGSRVVPIWIYKPDKYYQDLIHKINGVLLPGGSASLYRDDGYAKAARTLYGLAIEMNNNGIYFPVWGTCLGFELMIDIVANNKRWNTACDANNFATNLNFEKGYEKSKLFTNLDPNLGKTMKNKDVVINYHKKCLAKKYYDDPNSGLQKYFKVLAVNQDKNNLEYVSIVEWADPKYPFYGVAFHPEKAVFEWNVIGSYSNTVHTFDAIQVSQYFGNFFVNEARNNSPTRTINREELIYNFNATYVGKDPNRSTMQIYFFK